MTNLTKTNLLLKDIAWLSNRQKKHLKKMTDSHASLSKENMEALESKLLEAYQSMHDAIDIFRNVTNDIYED